MVHQFVMKIAKDVFTAPSTGLKESVSMSAPEDAIGFAAGRMEVGLLDDVSVRLGWIEIEVIWIANELFQSRSYGCSIRDKVIRLNLSINIVRRNL